MKKNLFRYPLMAAFACLLSLGFIACSDDDNKGDNHAGKDTEVMDADHTDEAIKAWAWVSVLTDEADQTDDWQDKTYTATIGEPSPNNPETARLIYVANLDDAKASFANIACCKPDELNASKTVSAGQFGSMVWNISAPGAPNIATAEVNCPLLPQLQQLIFCTEEQAPDNASEITGNCYYSVGDVVEDKQAGFYWVCVQPSFKGKKFKESYWMNVFNSNPWTGKSEFSGRTPGIPQKFICSKYNKKYNGNTIKLPTGLKLDRRQTHNLCNLAWAVKDPEKYVEKLNGPAVETGLGELPKEYVGKEYIEQMVKAWDQRKISQKLFNRTPNQLKELTKTCFFYYGYHWKVGSTAGVWNYHAYEYEAFYFGSLDDDDDLYEMKEKGYGFDVLRYVDDEDQDEECAKENPSLFLMAPYAQFTDEKHGYWVVRVATGKQLDPKYDPYEPMEGYYNTYNRNERFKYPVGPTAAVPEMK